MTERPFVEARRQAHLFNVLPFLLAALVLTLTLTCNEPAGAQEPQKEYVQSFKGPRENAKDFVPFGPDAEKCVIFEPDGLRITLPAGYPGDRSSTGVGSRFGVKGDFEITLSYEILQEPEAVDAGTQTRFAVSVTLDKPNSMQDQAALNYRVVPTKGRQFFAWQNLKNQATGKPQSQMIGFPTKAKAGRLRLVRNGAEVSYHAADGVDQEFALLQKFQFGAEDVRVVNIVAATGGPKAAIDVRVSDLRIRAAGFPPPGPPPVILLVPPPKEYAQEFHQQLRERVESIPGFEVIGPGKDQNVQLEATGMRVKLPPGWGGERPSTGLVTNFGVKGDFEVTLNFEVLHEPKQEDAGAAGGTRLNLAMVKDTPDSDISNINRTMSMKSGRIFYAWSTPVVNEKTAKVGSLHQPLRTEAMAGRLRLVRSGAEWYYGASEGVDADFRFFARYPFGPEDIRQIRIVTATGGEKASFEARFTDLRIRADSIPDMPAGPARPGLAADGQQLPGNKGWLIATVLVGGTSLVLFVAALGAGLYLRRRRPAPDRSPASAVLVSFPCPECGKSMKVKATLAGKKIKCPQCAKAVPVPHE